MSTDEAGGEAPVHLPDADDRRLDLAVIRLWRLGILLRTAGWAVALSAAGRFTPWNLPWLGFAAAAVAIGCGLAATWPGVRYRSWTFRMRERDLFVSRGIFWRTSSVIPFSRIQHVDTRHGPVERWLGLASVIVYTAGVRGADVTIPGLASGEAEALRERLAQVGGGEDAV